MKAGIEIERKFVIDRLPEGLLDTSAAREIRKFIKGFLAEHLEQPQPILKRARA